MLRLRVCRKECPTNSFKLVSAATCIIDRCLSCTDDQAVLDPSLGCRMTGIRSLFLFGLGGVDIFVYCVYVC